jgi:hypothetical protein
MLNRRRAWTTAAQGRAYGRGEAKWPAIAIRPDIRTCPFGCATEAEEPTNRGSASITADSYNPGMSVSGDFDRRRNPGCYPRSRCRKSRSSPPKPGHPHHFASVISFRRPYVCLLRIFQTSVLAVAAGASASRPGLSRLSQSGSAGLADPCRIQYAIPPIAKESLNPSPRREALAEQVRGIRRDPMRLR